MPFSENLKKLREKNKLTQEQLAEKLMISKTTVSHYEKSLHNPSLETIIKLAELFDVSIDYLLGRTSVYITFSSLQKPYASELSIDDFITMLSSLDKQHQSDLLAQMEYIRFHNDTMHILNSCILTDRLQRKNSKK